MDGRRIYYRLIEANALVPKLEYIFSELARIQKRVNDILGRAENMGVEINLEDVLAESSNECNSSTALLKNKLRSLNEEYTEHLDEIEDMGVVVEDPEIGVVNFFSVLEGEEVLLSWQYGEPEVGHWHEVDEDYYARRSLKRLVSRSPAKPRLH